MGFFNMFAIALSVLFFGSAQAAPFIPSGATPNTLIEPVQHRYRYYGEGGGYPDNGYIPGYGAVCSSPYVSVGDGAFTADMPAGIAVDMRAGIAVTATFLAMAPFVASLM
jgi:hypothetical protein